MLPDDSSHPFFFFAVILGLFEISSENTESTLQSYMPIIFPPKRPFRISRKYCDYIHNIISDNLLVELFKKYRKMVIISSTTLCKEKQ